MTRPTPISDLVADDLLLDRVASRQHAGDDPLAGILTALAAHADRPLRLVPSRRFKHHRALSALAALTIAASGAGVAAAVTLPDRAPAAVAPKAVPKAGKAFGLSFDSVLGSGRGDVTVQVQGGAWITGSALPATAGLVPAPTSALSGLPAGLPAPGVTGSPTGPDGPEDDNHTSDPVRNNTPSTPLPGGGSGKPVVEEPSQPTPTPTDGTQERPKDTKPTKPKTSGTLSAPVTAPLAAPDSGTTHAIGGSTSSSSGTDPSSRTPSQAPMPPARPDTATSESASSTGPAADDEQANG